MIKRLIVPCLAVPLFSCNPTIDSNSTIDSNPTVDTTEQANHYQSGEIVSQSAAIVTIYTDHVEYSSELVSEISIGLPTGKVIEDIETLSIRTCSSCAWEIVYDVSSDDSAKHETFNYWEAQESFDYRVLSVNHKVPASYEYKFDYADASSESKTVSAKTVTGDDLTYQTFIYSDAYDINSPDIGNGYKVPVSPILSDASLAYDGSSLSVTFDLNSTPHDSLSFDIFKKGSGVYLGSATATAGTYSLQGENNLTLGSDELYMYSYYTPGEDYEVFAILESGSAWVGNHPNNFYYENHSELFLSYSP